MHVSGQMTSPVEGEGKRDKDALGGMSDEDSRDRVTRGGMGIVRGSFSWEFKLTDRRNTRTGDRKITRLVKKLCRQVWLAIVKSLRSAHLRARPVETSSC